MVFVGVHPTLMHVPPRFFSSTRATDHPRSARRKERGSPAWPEPITMASYFIGSSDRGGAPPDSTSDAPRLNEDGEKPARDRVAESLRNKTGRQAPTARK